LKNRISKKWIMANFKLNVRKWGMRKKVDFAIYSNYLIKCIIP